MEYGKVLYYYLELRDISPAELARRIGSPRSTVNELLKGRVKEPTLGKAKAIADALDVSLEEMAAMVYDDAVIEEVDGR